MYEISTTELIQQAPRATLDKKKGLRIRLEIAEGEQRIRERDLELMEQELFDLARHIADEALVIQEMRRVLIGGARG